MHAREIHELDDIDLICRATSERATVAERIECAERALALDRTNVWGYLVLTDLRPIDAERIALLEEALRVDAEARPSRRADPEYFESYMGGAVRNAMFELALLRCQLGDLTRATAVAREMLEMSGRDGAGARYLLLAWYPVMGEWKRFQEVLRGCRHEESAIMRYTVLLEAIRQEEGVEEAFGAALERNIIVPRYLERQIHAPEEECWREGYSGSRPESEAEYYARNFAQAWQAVPGAIATLMERYRGGSQRMR